MGSSTFFTALVRASRLNPWKTKPSFWLRIAASSFLPSPSTRAPSSVYEPDVGVSRHPSRFISVDLPDPEAPMMATSSPRVTVRSTARRACTSFVPLP